MAISDYTIVSSNSIEDLIQQCAKLCEEGYTPVGGVAYNPTKELYHQALVSYDNRPANKVETVEVHEEVITSGLEVIGSLFEPDEWEDEFWIVAKEELSREAFFFVIKSHIRSVKMLLFEIRDASFEKNAGEQIFAELKKIIEKHQWKSED